MRNAGERAVRRLERHGEIRRAIEHADTMRRKEPFVRAGGEHRDSERTGMQWKHADGLHRVDDEPYAALTAQVAHAFEIVPLSRVKHHMRKRDRTRAVIDVRAERVCIGPWFL